MKYTLYRTPDGYISGMSHSGAMMGDGETTVAEFERQFDGSTPFIEFEMPPVPIEGYDDSMPELTDIQSHQLARVVYETVLKAVCETLADRLPDEPEEDPK